MLVTDLAELEDWAQLEGSELGEHCMNIVNCFSRLDCMSDEFITALNKEGEQLLKEFRAGAKIIELPMVHNYTQRFIEWN